MLFKAKMPTIVSLGLFTILLLSIYSISGVGLVTGPPSSVSTLSTTSTTTTSRPQLQVASVPTVSSQYYSSFYSNLWDAVRVADGLAKLTDEGYGWCTANETVGAWASFKFKEFSVFAVGDSILAGSPWHSPSIETYGAADNRTRTMTRYLSDLLGVEIINRAITGDGALGMANKLTDSVVDYLPEYIIAEAGTLDLKEDRTADSVISNLTIVIDIITEISATAIINTIPPSYPIYDGEPTREAYRHDVNDWIRNQSASDVIISDLDNLVRDPANISRLLPLYCSAGTGLQTHLSLVGMSVWANYTYELVGGSEADTQSHSIYGIEIVSIPMVETGFIENATLARPQSITATYATGTASYTFTNTTIQTWLFSRPVVSSWLTVTFNSIFPIFGSTLIGLGEIRIFGESQGAITTDLTVLDIPFENDTQVQNHLWESYWLTSFPNNTCTNYTLGYDSSQNAAKIGSTRNATGAIAFGGFVPAIETTLSFDVKIPRLEIAGAHMTFYWYGMEFKIEERIGFYRLTLVWYNSTGAVKTTIISGPTLPDGYDPWIHVELTWFGNSTWAYSLTDGDSIAFEGYNKSHQDYIFDTPLTMIPSTMFLISVFPYGDYETYNYHYLKNLQQTVPAQDYAIYATSPTESYAALGFDYPVQSALVNFTPILEAYNSTCTIFFHTPYLNHPSDNYYNDSNIVTLMDAGFEAGLHTDTKETYNETGRDSLDNFVSLLYNQTYPYWGNVSFIWTSLGNDYAWAYSDYMWETYDAIGRKYWGHWATNQGGSMTPLAEGQAERGIPWIRYMHYIGGDVPDMTPEEFEDLISDSIDNELSVVGYLEYWTRYAAPAMATVTPISGWHNAFNINYDTVSFNNQIEAAATLSDLGYGDATFVGCWDLTREENIATIIENSERAIFNISLESNYCIPLCAVAAEETNLTLTITTLTDKIVRWTAEANELSGTIIFRLSGLDPDKAYRVSVDGEFLAVGDGPIVSFTYIGDWSTHEFELMEWHDARVSALILLTIDMVGLGIIVAVLASYVAPIARDIQEKRPIKPEKLTQNLIRTVIFIVVASLMWGVLYTIALG